MIDLALFAKTRPTQLQQFAHSLSTGPSRSGQSATRPIGYIAGGLKPYRLVWHSTRPMGLLDTEPGKRRLLSVEVPAIETYNEGRDPEYRVSVTRSAGVLVLSYRLKPCHNAYRVETRLLSSYPVVPPETRILTPLKHCPHLLEGQTLCLWRQGSTRAASRWDPTQFTCVFAVLAAWRWLACYELWHETGEWPLPEAK